MTKQMDRYIYVHKAADILGCRKNYIYDLIKNGHLDAIRIGKRAIRVSEASLNDFIESRKVDPEEYFE